MAVEPDIARAATLMADPTRAGLLVALLDGRPAPATDLARRIAVPPSSASGHLTKLVSGGLLRVERHGRHRYYRLAGAEVAAAVEALAAIAPTKTVVGLRRVQASEAMAFARTCYDHVAGALGVAIADCFLDGTALTSSGEAALRQLGVDLESLARQRRALVRPCLDWTERRPHLAGAAGAAVLAALESKGWVTRRRNDRALTLSTAGRRGLRRLGVTVPPSA